MLLPYWCAAVAYMAEGLLLQGIAANASGAGVSA